jgi:hypothetical protein
MKEASAMTEASELMNERDAIEQTSDARRQTLQSPSQDAAIRWAERLRKVTAKPPCSRIRYSAASSGRLRQTTD